MSRLDWFNFLRILWRREMNMALYYLLLRGWLHLGDSVAWIRGLSVIFAVAAIPAIFLLGRKMLGARFGLVSALLLSVNAFQVRYAQEARSYSLLVWLVIVSNYFFISGIESGRRRDWNWYIVASSLAIYAHFFAVLVVVAHWVALRLMSQAGVIASGPDIRLQFRRAARLVALWTSPIWIFIATTGAGPIAWIPRPGLGDIIGLLKKLSGNAETMQLVLYAVCVLGGLVAGGISIRRRRPDSLAYVTLACWFFVPLVIVLVVSIARPVFAPRYFMISLPAWIMLAAAGITTNRSRLMAGLLTIVVALSCLDGIRAYYKADFDIGRNDVRSATAYILDHAQPHDGVVFYSLSTRFPYDYYAAHTNAAVKPDTLWPGNNAGVGWRDFMGVPAAARVPDFAKGRERIWVVTTPLPPNDPRFAAFTAALNQQYKLTDTQDFPFVQVMLFSK
jgi:4-amino-4-deoxy-L-arabinose transferase-like glycosyltransferase